MRQKKVFSILLVIIVLGFAGVVGADDTITYNNAKTLGMGNARIAGGFNYNGFVDNPALLSRVRYVRFSIVNVPIGVNDNLMDMSTFIKDNANNFAEFDSLSIQDKQAFLDDIEEYDSKWGRVRVAPMFDLAANIKGYGVGIAVFSTTDVALKVDKGIYEPRVWGEGRSNVAVVIGMAKPVFMLYPGLTLGMNIKYLERRKANLLQIPASDLGNFNDTIKPVTDKVKNDASKHIALDFGALLDLPLIGTEVGATLQSIGDGRGASLDFGVAKQMWDDRLILLADYIDFLDNNRENIFSKIHFGVELNAEPLALRAGISKGYPALGLGLNFRLIDIDAAYYTEELSKGPGGNDESRYVVQIKVGW
ncbi:hypothetical protein ACFL5H_01225 [Candidatus Latescibacterota bacterium]